MLSLEKYAELTGDIETKLDEADHAAASDIRYTHVEVINMLNQEFNLETAKEVWQEEGRKESLEEVRVETLILCVVNVIRGVSLSVTDAMALINLDAKHRNKLIEELQRQGVEYTE